MTLTSWRSGTAQAMEHARRPRRVNRGQIAAWTAGLTLLFGLARPPAGTASQLPTGFVDQLIVEGLSEPTGLAFLPDQRLLVIERNGAVRLLAEGKLGAIDPLFICDYVDAMGDRGATGIAVDPRWPVMPYIYVYYDATDMTCKLVRYTVGGDVAISSSLYLTIDPASRHDIITDIPDLQTYHNGGTLRFGPDSMLYAALGEDGDACAAQDTTSLRGVMLRLDIRGLPAGPGGPPNRNLLVAPGNPLATHPVTNARLVWAYGLRNPFRFHFDPATGSIFVADVGYLSFEEIDLISSPMSNYGWPYFEGPMSYVPDCGGIVPGPGLTPPIYAYDRIGFTASVIGGGVYRATPCGPCSFPAEYEGDYFFTDFYEGFLRRIKFDGSSWAVAPAVPGQPSSLDWGRGFEEVTDFLEGVDGALWYVKMGVDYNPGSGEVHRIYHESPLADVGDAGAARVKFAAPYPTPSRGSVSMRYELPRAATVDLDVLDPQGRLVTRVAQRLAESPGVHHGIWDGRGPDGRRVAPGVYLARLHADDTTLIHRIVIVH